MIELKVAYSAAADDAPEPDRRYRTLVILARTDRPTYYKFHCPRCNMPVSELVNNEVVALTDVVDMASSELVGVRCDGRFQGGRCSIWYYFTLGAV